MKEVKIGIVGVGVMGDHHAGNILAGKIDRMRLTAVCDRDPARLTRFDPAIRRFENSAELIRSGAVDAILVATPHYFHTTIGMDALENGLHLLMEKPISVHKADCEKLIAAARKAPKQVFAAMFNMRTDPHYRKVRDLIRAGELGDLTRVNWIVTSVFRTQHYYDSGGWRATWKGEGGGVLLNQCPHNLDLLQWLCGMPARVRAFCQLGKWHSIEVEDQVTAYFEYADGATGVFIATTGEAPGTNRLEICGDRGKVVIEDEKISFIRNSEPMRAFSKNSRLPFAKPDVWDIRIPVKDSGGQHNEILQNFVGAILDGAPPIAPAAEGIHSVELANAMLMSSLTDRTVDLPMDSRSFAELLDKLVRDSRFQKNAVLQAGPVDLSSSFHTGAR